MKIAIIGYGVYGAATAKLLKSCGNEVYVRTDDVNYTIMREENGIKITTDYSECLKNAKLVYVLIPALYTKDAFKEIKNYIDENMIIILGSKGILNNSMLIEDA